MNDTQTTKPEIDDLPPKSPVTQLASDTRGIPPEKSSEEGSLFDIFSSLRAFKNICDYIGGSREEAPEGIPLLASPWWFGLWWGLLAGVILLFCGQTSKFIYIDF
jgi:hypothetical protein